MQLIVYGYVEYRKSLILRFPSKLTALQVGSKPWSKTNFKFEWAWQKPELSRHLRQGDEVRFKKDNKRNHVQRKIR